MDIKFEDDGFAAWEKEVDRIMQVNHGVGIDCLPDWASWDAWDSGMSAHSAAEAWYQSAGDPL